MKKLILLIASLAATPAMAAGGTMYDDIKLNAGVKSAWMSDGPCNHKNSFAWSTENKNGKLVTIEKHPLDCHSLMTMVMANGRISYMFIGDKANIGFASNGVPRNDNDGKPEYIEVDHLYPYDYAFWNPVRKAVHNAMITNNVNGRCMRTPHKDFPNKTVVLCVATYFADQKHAYNWGIEITEEQIMTIKGDDSK